MKKEVKNNIKDLIKKGTSPAPMTAGILGVMIPITLILLTLVALILMNQFHA